jgi:hypothetical protein
MEESSPEKYNKNSKVDELLLSCRGFAVAEQFSHEF